MRNIAFVILAEPFGTHFVLEDLVIIRPKIIVEPIHH